MVITAVSDLHGFLPDMKDVHCDVFCICGDIVPLALQYDMLECEDWIKNSFVTWCSTIDAEHILLVAGNHDVKFERNPTDYIKKWFKDTNITYLFDEYIEIDGVKFLGTPWCHKFGDWAFMKEDDELTRRFNNFTEHCDVLLTHDKPYGYCDICLKPMWWNKGDHIGSKPLLELINRLQPTLSLSGHLHSANHNRETINCLYDINKKCSVYNVALVDEHYKLKYKPLTIALLPDYSQEDVNAIKVVELENVDRNLG